MARRWWDTRIIGPCRSAWTTLDGRNHRRQNAQVPALIDLYREAGRRAGHLPDQLKVGIHSLGYVAERTQEAADDFFSGYAHTMTEVGKERGWLEVTRVDFDAQRDPQGALLIGDPDEVVEKIVRHSKTLGGISRITFMMNAASLPHVKLMRAIELIGTRVAPALREQLGGNDGM
jgi:alkanesulfonate monooxygenase SsuD/methylene tetrahydromethanopterin reductase-like flavin-dependent oxidoreductase (luciferase family)